MPDVKIFYQNEEITEKHRRNFSSYMNEAVEDMVVLNDILETALSSGDDGLRRCLKAALWKPEPTDKDASYYKMRLLIRAVRRNRGLLGNSLGSRLHELGISKLFLLHAMQRHVIFLALLVGIIVALVMWAKTGRIRY